MDENLTDYKAQLLRVQTSLEVTDNDEDRQNLLSLQNDLQQLISLYSPETVSSEDTNNESTSQQDEYALFMSELRKYDAFEENEAENQNLSLELSSLEGTRCRAPHQHSWGELSYHNALITTVYECKDADLQSLQVKVLFTNPTHKEMQPCPYFLHADKECRFTDDACRYSHGEIVQFSSLQEYVEPDFASVEVGSRVLAKQDDDLWHCGSVRRIFSDKQACDIKLDNTKHVQVDFVDLLPLTNVENDSQSATESDTEINKLTKEDFVNMSLLTDPGDEKFGSWEKHTKGIGSKLMQKMGYVIGTGLGRHGEGRIEPVTAVALPRGKSLDHCMELREKSGGDKYLFNAERKRKRVKKSKEQRKSEKQCRKAEAKGVFKVLNKMIQRNKAQVNREMTAKMNEQHKKDIQKESKRNLNVQMFELERSLKQHEKQLIIIDQAIVRNKDTETSYKRCLRRKSSKKLKEIDRLKEKLQNIKNEQSLRNSTKSLTTF